MINIGSDFSGVGSFIQALQRLGIKHNEVFACDMDKYARQTYCLNFGTEEDYQLSLQKQANPKDFSFYFPYNVYEREIPKEPLDIYMTSPPCQSFSLAGKRKGENDERGVLFYNSHEFIKKNKPRYFIFENVKGLLSDDNGKTFRRWLDYLGGKTINGNPVIFPHEESVPYHIYYKVLNAKNYGVPQNRERIFIVGIRDDTDNTFTWAKPIPLKERLKDRLEKQVDEKYFLSDKLISSFINRPQSVNYPFKPLSKKDTHIPCLTARYYKMAATDPYIKEEVITENDTIDMKGIYGGNRGNVVMKNMARTLDHNCNQAVIEPQQPASLQLAGNLSGGKWDKINESCRRYYSENGLSPTIHTCQGGNTEPKVFTNYRIRKLTPAECFNLMDFNKNFKWEVSDTQAYKQAGNSIVVACLVAIISKLKLS